MPTERTFTPPTGRQQTGAPPPPSPSSPYAYRANPYAAEAPRGNVRSLPGQPGAQEAHIPTGPYDDPKDSHPGPVGPPAVRVWQEDSSSEFWRTHTERPQSPTPQGSYVAQGIGQTRGMRSAPDVKWTPETVIRTMYPPSASQLIARPFDKRKTERMSGGHGSMAGRKRAYQLIPGQRPVTRLTATYRIVPPSRDERLAEQRGQPALSVEPVVDRSQGGTWRLF